jgi:hypothetical protein
MIIESEGHKRVSVAKIKFLIGRKLNNWAHQDCAGTLGLAGQLAAVAGTRKQKIERHPGRMGVMTP